MDTGSFTTSAAADLASATTSSVTNADQPTASSAATSVAVVAGPAKTLFTADTDSATTSSTADAAPATASSVPARWPAATSEAADASSATILDAATPAWSRPRLWPREAGLRSEEILFGASHPGMSCSVSAIAPTRTQALSKVEGGSMVDIHSRHKPVKSVCGLWSLWCHGMLIKRRNQ